MEPSRRAALVGVKLRALVSQHVGHDVDAVPVGVLDGAALLHRDAAWVLLEGDATAALGTALAWSVRQGARSIHVVAERGGGAVARRAARFSMPISVWYPQDRTLLPTVAEPLVAPPVPSDEHLALCPTIVEAGAAPIVEHGVVSGEVRGLQVCRVVDTPTVGFVTEAGDMAPLGVAGPDEMRLEVGVGDADREAFALLHGDMPTMQALTTVVDTVVRHRSDDAPQHPLNRLGRERYLRWMAETEPERVGLVEMSPSEPPIRRANLKDPVPCVGVGTDSEGRRWRVVFSSGVDLDLVPFAADVQEMYGDPVRLAVPARDALALQHELAALLREPAELLTID